jgi:hypothetical protein
LERDEVEVGVKKTGFVPPLIPSPQGRKLDAVGKAAAAGSNSRNIRKKRKPVLSCIELRPRPFGIDFA